MERFFYSIRSGYGQKIRVCSEYLIKTGDLKKWQLLRLAILQQFLAIFCQLHIHILQNLGLILIVILRGWRCLNPNWIQIYSINYKCCLQVGLFTSMFCKFGRKKNENSSFKKGNFLTVCGHFCGNNIAIFHKIEIQTVILKCCVYLNLNWIKIYEIISG